MMLQGHSDLDLLNQLPDPVRADLRSRWVESVEELLGLLAALETPSSPTTVSRPDPILGATAAFRGQALTLVGPTPAAELRLGRPGGALGCVVPDETLRRFHAERRVSGLRTALPQGFAQDTLPKAVRLTSRLPTVRDQGARGTCVAFATVALREFLEPDGHRLSEQFLYWACKELDGRESPGTTLHTAMSSLAQYGCCREQTWPYDPAPRPDNESHRPPPRGALEDATRFRMPNCRTVEPSWVDQYRRILAGQDGVQPTPVVVGVLVFPSWFYSPATHRTGKITLPFPYEEPEGGHAMCVVGYVDDTTAPGGGYFIVRNSWGPRWAYASPEAPGHALMPYAYFEAYCLEAFTGPALRDAQSASSADSNSDFRRHTRTLTRELRDQDGPPGQGRLLRPGTGVLFHPLAPDEVMEDTEANRRRFLELDHAWTLETRQRVWFPEIATFPEPTRAVFDRVRTHQSRFFAAIEANLQGAVGTPFPYGRLPRWAFLVPCEWEPKIQSLDTAADLSDRWVQELQRRSGTRPDLPWPTEWTTWLRELNRFVVLRLSRGSAEAHVVVVHLAPVKCTRGKEPRLADVSRALLDAAQALYRAWRTTSSAAAETPVFFTVALEGPASDSLENPASETLRETLVTFLPDGTWTVPPPRQDHGRRSLRDFLDRLRPETREQRLARLRKAIDDEIENYGGNVSERHLRKVTGARRSQIREAFFHLQRAHPDHYRVQRLPDGELGIRPRRDHEAISITEGGRGRRALRRHLLGIASLAIGALLATGNDWLKSEFGLPIWVSTATGVVIAYVGQLVQKSINERAESGRD